MGGGKTGVRYFSGLDLGQVSDFTALAVLERTTAPDAQGRLAVHLACRHLQRWQLGTGYPEIVASLQEMFGKPPLSGSTLCIDATGVGRPVGDTVRGAGHVAASRPVVITARHGVTAGQGGARHVPKIHLVGVLQSALQQRRLQIAASLPEAATLVRELETFKVKVTAAGNETFESWQERDHDDLVLAVAIAAWEATRGGVGWDVVHQFNREIREGEDGPSQPFWVSRDKD
jgi:hypothetical protein